MSRRHSSSRFARGATFGALALTACGRLGFEPAGGDGPNDGAIGSDADVVSRDRCPAAPRPSGSPATRVGTGTPQSCTGDALTAALATGGWIGFDCGPAPTTIALSSPLTITRATILDGGGLITLDGGGTSRVLVVAANTDEVTLLDLGIANGASTDSGAGVRVVSGRLVVIGSTLNDNRGPVATGVEGGGAIAAVPPSATIAVYDSKFRANASANGGAINSFAALTVVESTFVANSATGSGGGMGNGGLGGAIQAAGPGDVTLCGVTLEDNMAGELGGAIHRVCITGGCTDTIERTSIMANSGPRGGGVYHQNATLRIAQTTIAQNKTTSGASGLWHIGGTLDAENLTVAENTSMDGPGAGISAESSGTIAFSTIVGNRCTGAGCLSAGLKAITTLQLRATVIANNSVDVPGAPLSCANQLVDSGDNIQWPVVRPLGGSDDPGALCTAAIQIADPLLSSLVERAGSDGKFLVATPTIGSPALATVTSCPPTDQLGRSRPVPCSAGAVEP